MEVLTWHKHNELRTTTSSDPKLVVQRSQAGRRPEFTVKVGNVEIASWRNQGQNGEFFTTSASKIRYREGEQWKDGSSYGRHDLLVLAEAAREAATKIRDLTQGAVARPIISERKGHRTEPGGPP